MIFSLIILNFIDKSASLIGGILVNEILSNLLRYIVILPRFGIRLKPFYIWLLDFVIPITSIIYHNWLVHIN